MCSHILYIFKAMGSKWSVVFLAIVTLFFVNNAHAEDRVQIETFNVSNICHQLNKTQQHIFSHHPPVYAFGFSDSSAYKDNSSFTEQGPRRSSSNFLNSFTVTGIFGLILVLSCVSSNLKESKKVVRLLEKKVVVLNSSLWKMGFAYHGLLDDYETTQAQLEEALVKIKTLELKLEVKSQAVFEVQGLLNDSIVMVSDEMDKVKRREAAVIAKYKSAKEKLKISHSQSAKLSEEIGTLEDTNEKLEELMGKLKEEAMEYRDLLPFAGKRRRIPKQANPLIDHDPILEQPILSIPESSQVPVPESSHEISVDYIVIQSSLIPNQLPKKKKNIFKRTWVKVFSRKPKKSTPKSENVDYANMTLRSNFKERVGPKPP